MYLVVSVHLHVNMAVFYGVSLHLLSLDLYALIYSFIYPQIPISKLVLNNILTSSHT